MLGTLSIYIPFVLVYKRIEMQIESRLKRLERFKDWAEPLLRQTKKVLELSAPKANILKYCHDELDRRIMSYLIEVEVAGTTEIAGALGFDPARGRHLVGKRLRRIEERASADGEIVLRFRPERLEHKGKPKFRAWWVELSNIDVRVFRGKVPLN